MALIPVVLANGRSVEFEIRTDLEGPALFILSVRKCGSSIFNNIVHAMAMANDCNYVNIGGTFFRANVLQKDYGSDEALLAILQRGNVYGGLRNMAPVLLESPLFRSAPKLLIIRDPRDALVSLYFSNAYSHPIPQTTGEHDEVTQQMERQRATALAIPLDEYVIANAKGIKQTMTGYKQLLGDARTTVLKYEDYIFEKRAFMLTAAEKFGWRADEALIAQTLEWADVRPADENPTAFVRKVTPGDHREKLEPATIAALNEVLMPVFRLFGYS